MNKVIKKLERLFTAISFAEAGEIETARQIMKEDPKEQKQQMFRSKKGLRMVASPAKS